MPEIAFDSNQFMMMINILNVFTERLKDEVSELKIEEVEQRWKELLSTLQNCFSYAQSNGVDLREYKNDLREITENLYDIEKSVRHRKDKKVSLLDDIAQGLFFIAGKIDDVLDGIGWKRVVRPITEAIFMIPQKIISMFSSASETPPMLPEAIQKYLPSPIKSLPSSYSTQPTVSQKANDIIDVEWVDVKDSKESFASQVLRRMHDKISHIESGDE